MEDIVANLKRFGQISELDRFMEEWEEMDNKSKLYYLWESEIDGICSVDDYFSYGEVILETNKREMLNIIAEELDNLEYGHDMEDSNHYTIAYADGTIIHTEDLERNKFKKTGIIWICPTGGITYNKFFALNKKAKAHLLNYMDMKEIIRGEIKGLDFNYEYFERMTDDWI